MILRTIPRYGLKIPRKLLSVATRQVMGTITHVATDDAVVALTFDDGPHAEFTPRLLDILERYQARATFFMLGEAAQQQPELVRRVAEAGHTIGNHSWDHPSFPLITSHERRAQIRACERALAPYGQRLFRPPCGQQSVASCLDALRLGYKVITWDLEVGDWWDRDPERMADLLINRVHPGSVIVLHDALRSHPSAALRPRVTLESYATREAMLTALTLFLEQTAARFRFVTIPELLRRGRPYRQHWYRTAPAAG